MKTLHLSLKGIVVSITVLTAVLFLWTHAAFAQTTPAVTAVTASPTSISNGHTLQITWTTVNATGDDLYFTCPVGVTITSAAGVAFSCDTRQSFSANASDSAVFTVKNIAGTSQTINVTVYPKDSTGADYDAGSMSTSFSVSTSPQPIITFSLSTTSIASNAPVTLTWAGVDTPGVNIEFDCTSNVQVTATSPSVTGSLPCGTTAFSSDLSQSGSATINITNSSITSPATLTLRVVPLIATGAYDMTHSRAATVTVAPVTAQMTPTTASFTSSLSTVTSGAPFTLSWATQNAAGANIQLTCDNGAIHVVSISGAATSSLPCNVPAFTPALSASGTSTIEASLQGAFAGILQLTLLPQGSDGSYYQTTGRSLNVLVTPPGATPPPTTTINTPTQPAAVSTTTAVNTKPTAHYTFTLALHRGSSNADVTALQKYLALDPSIYPLGLVTGYFGAATQQAVDLFQVKYGIAGQGDSGYGLVGPKTRAKLNALQ